MSKKLLMGTVAAVTGMLLAGSANALTVEIALSQSGGSGATGMTTVATSSSGSAVFGGTFGNFNVNLETVNGTGAGNILPEPDLNSNTQDSSTVSGGCASTCTLKVWITETGLTFPPGPKATFQSAFTWNTLLGNTAPADVTFTNYISDTNNPFAQTEQVGTAVGNQAVMSTPLIVNGTVTDLTTPFSITEEYSETCTGGFCSFNLSDDLSNVPEPASLSLLGGGLLAFGAWRRRRQTRQTRTA